MNNIELILNLLINHNVFQKYKIAITIRKRQALISYSMAITELVHLDISYMDPNQWVDPIDCNCTKTSIPMVVNDTTEVVIELTIIFLWLVYIGEFTGEKGRSHHS